MPELVDEDTESEKDDDEQDGTDVGEYAHDDFAEVVRCLVERNFPEVPVFSSV
jgi:hypothetical protein